MLEHFALYIQRLWGSTLPNRLMWAIAVALIFELLVWLLSKRLRRAMGRVMQRDAHLDAAERVRRRQILLNLPLQLLRIVLYALGILIILRYLGFDTRTELIPVGLALTGLATLVSYNSLRDTVAGYFILFDDLYAVGDRVTIGEYSGQVLEIGLRQTRLRGPDGRETSLANRTITTVVNHTRAAEIERKAGRV